MRHGPHVLDLSFAKHRFNGSAKPLRVLVWNLEAVISTCTVIAGDSANKDQYNNMSKEIIDELCPERIILTGMLADASDEAMVLCHFFDQEAFEPDQMAAQSMGFRARVRQ